MTEMQRVNHLQSDGLNSSFRYHLGVMQLSFLLSLQQLSCSETGVRALTKMERLRWEEFGREARGGLGSGREAGGGMGRYRKRVVWRKTLRWEGGGLLGDLGKAGWRKRCSEVGEGGPRE